MIKVGDWSSAQCGSAGWETDVVQLLQGMPQDQVDKLVEPLLLLGEQLTKTRHTLHVTLLPVGAASHITKVMASSVQSSVLLSNQRVVVEDAQADTIMASSLPPLYSFTSSGSGQLKHEHHLADFITAHFVMLGVQRQGLHEHYDDVHSQVPDAMIHLVKTACTIRDGGDGCTNFFFRDVQRKRMIVLCAQGGVAISATANLLML